MRKGVLFYPRHLCICFSVALPFWTIIANARNFDLSMFMSVYSPQYRQPAHTRLSTN